MEKFFILLCEEIRDERNGARTLIGVFPIHGIKMKTPALFPKFGIYTVSSFDYLAKFKNIKLKIENPKNEKIFETSILQYDKAENTNTAVIAINISPLPFPMAGEYTFTFFGENGTEEKTKFLIVNE